MVHLSPKFLGLIAIVVALLGTSRVNAAPLIIGPDFTKLTLDDVVAIRHDPTSSLRFEDVAAPAAANDMVIPPKGPNFGLATGNYWGRLELENRQPDPVTAYFEFTYAVLDYVDVYVPLASGGHTLIETGDWRPFVARPVDFHNVVIPVTLAPNGKGTIYFRASSSTAVSLGTRLWSPKTFSEHVAQEQIILGLYYGSILSLTIYNSALLFSTGEIIYLFYAMFTLSTLLFFSVWNGIGFQVLWPTAVNWQNTAQPFFLCQVLVWSLGFTRLFLELATRMPRTNRAIGILLSIAAVGSLMPFLVPPRIALEIALVLVVLSCSTMLVVGTYSLIKGFRPAIFYVSAWIVLLGASILSALAAAGLLKLTLLVHYSTQIGSAAEALLLSFATGDRFNQIKRQRFMAQRKLKDRLHLMLQSTKRMAVATNAREAGAEAARSVVQEIGVGSNAALDLYLAYDGAPATRKLRYVTGGKWQDQPEENLVPEVPSNDDSKVLTSRGESPGVGTFAMTLEHGGVAVQSEDSDFVDTVVSSLTVALEVIYHRQHLTTMVEQRTRDIRYLLEHIQQGIVTFTGTMCIDPEFSHYLCELYQTEPQNIAGTDFVDFMFPDTTLTKDQIECIRQCLRASIGEAEVVWGINEHHLPARTEITVEDRRRVIDLQWTPIVDQNWVIAKVMLSVRDVTDRIELEQQLALEQRGHERQQKIIGEIIRKRRSNVRDFLYEARALLTRAKGGNATGVGLKQFARELHTIKGAARHMGFREIIELAHEAETLLTAKNETAAATDAFAAGMAALDEAVAAYKYVVDEVLGGQGAEDAGDLPSLASAVAQLVGGMRQSLEKGGLHLGAITLKDEIIDWTQDAMRVVSDVLLHAFTNSVDHGFVLPRESGHWRGGDAKIAVTCRRVGGAVELVIADEGAGFDLEKIRGVAAKKGFKPVNESEEALLAVLLEDGMSTTDRVTRTSGRGVGLAAMAAIAKGMGGDLQLRRNVPHGAVVTVLLPETSLNRQRAA